MYEWHMFGGGFMWLFWIVILGLLVWFVVAATRQPGGRGEGRKSAREILDERYARGEIDREEYEQKRADLDR